MSLNSLELFGLVVKKGNPGKPVILQEYGVVVSPGAVYDLKAIQTYLRKTGVGLAELNSSFWSSWQEISQASDFELRADQILHYLTTYGFESLGIDGLIYIPNDVLVSRQPIALKAIYAADKEEIIRRCFDLLNSGIALSQETVDNIVETLLECDYVITGEEHIRNRETQIRFYEISQVLPSNGDELFRYLIYKFSGKTLVINNAVTRDAIKASKQFLPTFTLQQLQNLAGGFNRHRDLWMAIKSASPANITQVNQISRLSKTYHKPLRQNTLNLLTQPGRISKKDLEKDITNATVFQLVRAYNALALREMEPTGSVYLIRNGKQWTKEGEPFRGENIEKYKEILLDEIRFRFKHVKLQIEPFVDYAFPTSEKSFIGNIPNGTILRFGDKQNLLVGVHWEDYDTDLDFRADADNFSLGWNSSLKKGVELMHSGDMTRAPEPYGATEWIYASGELSNSYNLKVNLYRGSENFDKHFKMIIGVSSKTPDQSKQIPPEDIITSFDVAMTSKEMSVGFMYSDGEYPLCLYLNTSGTGNSRIGRYNRFDVVQQDVTQKKIVSGLRLGDVFKIVSKPTKGAVVLDISNLTKDSFLEVLK